MASNSQQECPGEKMEGRNMRSMPPDFRISGGLKNSSKVNSKGPGLAGCLSCLTVDCLMDDSSQPSGYLWLSWSLSASGSPPAVLARRGSSPCFETRPTSISYSDGLLSLPEIETREAKRTKSWKGSYYSAKLPLSSFFMFSSIGLHLDMPSED